MRTRHRGFSLVELMIAIAILVVAIFGTLAALAISANLRTTSSEMEVAHQEVQKQLAKYRAMSTLLDVVNSIYSDPDGAATKYGVHEFVLDDDVSRAQSRLKNGRGFAFVLSEAQTRDSFQVDTNKDGSLTAADTWDLDKDGVFDEGPTGTVSTSNNVTQATAATFIGLLPVRIIIQWDPHTARGDATKQRQLVFDTFIYPAATN